jgi:acyl carrier protein
MMQQVSETTNIEDQVRAYIVDSFLSEQKAAAFDNDVDLLMVLDSLQVLRMVLALEKQYGIKVQENELAPENLGSVSKIAAFIARKQKQG